MKSLLFFLYLRYSYEFFHMWSHFAGVVFSLKVSLFAKIQVKNH